MIRDWLAQMDARERKRSEQFLFMAQLLPFAERDGAYRRFIGDAAVPGRGEILIWQPRA